MTTPMTTPSSRVTAEKSEDGGQAFPQPLSRLYASASSEPKAVTITDEMVARAGAAIWDILAGEGVRLTTEDVLNYSDVARAALTAALNGADHEASHDE